AQRTKQIGGGVSAAVRVRLGDDLAGGDARAPVAGGVRAVGLIAEPAAVDLVVARRAPHGGRRFSVHGRARLRRPSAGAVRPAARTLARTSPSRSSSRQVGTSFRATSPARGCSGPVPSVGRPAAIQSSFPPT